MGCCLKKPPQAQAKAADADVIGASFELQLQLDAGKQVLNDKALRQILAAQIDEGVLIQSKSFIEQLEDVCFGVDVDVGGSAQECLGESCGICFSEPGVLQSPARRFCGNPDCKVVFCQSCLTQYVVGKITDALHFAPPILCPGCKIRIQTSTWAPLVPVEARTRYKANAEALLTVRCATCDVVSTLLAPAEPDASSKDAEQQLFALCGENGDTEALKRAWCQYSLGLSSAKKMLEALVPGAMLGNAQASDGEPPAHVRKIILIATSLIQDEERRLTFQLAALRRYPKIRTMCCGTKMCFKCKVKGWHRGISCEVRQQRYLGAESVGVQSCPTCGIPTQRTEGCTQVQCVCGCSWNWELSKEDQRRELGVSSAPLALACLALPNLSGIFSTDVFLKSLLEKRADIAAVQPDGWTAAHFAAMRAVTVKRHDYVSPSDASRLEVLFQLHPDCALDSLDTDGDTPLSVALANNNVMAAKFLVSHGSKFQPSVLKSVQSCTKPNLRSEACSMIRPLAERRECLLKGTERLCVELEFGLAVQENVHMLPFEEPSAIDIDLAKAFLWGMWREAGFGAFVFQSEGDESNECNHSNEWNEKDVAAVLIKAAGSEQWHNLCQDAATHLLWRTLQEGWPHESADLEALSKAIEDGAQLGKGHDAAPDGKLPALEALERQDLGAFGILMADEAVVRVLTTDFLDDSDGGFFTCMKLLALSSRAWDFLRVIEPWLETVGANFPAWLRVLCLPSSAHVQEYLEGVPPEMLNTNVAVMLLKRALLGDAADRAIVLGEECWAQQLYSNSNHALDYTELVKESASALLLLELRHAYNFERDPEISILKVLLEDFGADPNSSSQRLRPELRIYADCGAGEESSFFVSPLMTMVLNSYARSETLLAGVDLLIQWKADVNQPDEDGDTALYYAFDSSNIRVAEALLVAGAEVSDSSLEVLQTLVHPEMLRLVATGWSSQRIAQHENPDIVSRSVFPPWFSIQFGLAISVEDLGLDVSQSAEMELAVASILSEYCGGNRESQEQLLHDRFGAERWSELKRNAIDDMLQREVEGALRGDWVIDEDFVYKLLEEGADPNTQVGFEMLESDTDSDHDSASEAASELEGEAISVDADTGSEVSSEETYTQV